MTNASHADRPHHLGVKDGTGAHDANDVVDGLALGSATGRIALTATIAASAMASLDATVVNVALPHIGQDLDASVSQLQWVLTGYLLALASLILLAGALGDRWGRRRVFVLGTIWFAAASLLCGIAPTIEVLIVARVRCKASAVRCSHREASPSSSPASGRQIAQPQSVRGRGSEVWPARWARSSGASSSVDRDGGGRS